MSDDEVYDHLRNLGVDRDPTTLDLERVVCCDVATWMELRYVPSPPLRPSICLGIPIDFGETRLTRRESPKVIIENGRKIYQYREVAPLIDFIAIVPPPRKPAVENNNE